MFVPVEHQRRSGDSPQFVYEQLQLSTESCTCLKGALMPFSASSDLLQLVQLLYCPLYSSILSILFREQPVKTLHPSTIHVPIIPSVYSCIHHLPSSFFRSSFIPADCQPRQVHLCCDFITQCHIWP